MSPEKIDLHMHTTLSDGHLTPTELVRLLHNRGVTVAAISDHDSTEGLDEAFEAAKKYPSLRLIPAIEISADHPTEEKSDVHVLGYFLDYHNDALQKRLREFRGSRERRGEMMVMRLVEQGYAIEWERVKEIAGDAGIGRPHIAQVLVEKGYIAHQRDAFNGILDDDGIAFVDRPHITISESVDLIRSAGGVAVLAHPLFIPEYEKVLSQLPELGVAGFEVHYAEFSSEKRTELARLADEYGMIKAGGSDYHAMAYDGENLPGTVGPPIETVVALERLADEARSAG
jgi:predicted metal-dependent phosphoesterase TrpH